MSSRLSWGTPAHPTCKDPREGGTSPPAGEADAARRGGGTYRAFSRVSPRAEGGPRGTSSSDEGSTIMTTEEYIEIVHRELPFPTFDADNHLYETADALTRFLP